MNPLSSLSNTQSLTGEAKIESLNSIYNRVAMLRAKNITRKLIQSGNDQSQSFLTNNYQTPFNQNNQYTQQQTANFPNNNFISTKRLTKPTYDDKQSDNIETNFWPSENIIQQSRMVKLIGKQVSQQKMVIPNGEGRRRVLSTSFGVNKISKTMSVRGDNHQGIKYMSNNRRYLMSDYVKNQQQNSTLAHQSLTSKLPNQPNPKRPLSTNKLTKPFSSQLSSQKTIQSTKRPLTSSIGRQKHNTINYRISQKVVSSRQSLLNSKEITSNYGKVNLQEKGAGNKNTNENVMDQNKNNINNNNTLSRKSLNNSRVSLIKGQTRYTTYKQQITKFQKLYQCLSQVLISIKQGLQYVQRAVSMYSNFIQSNKLTFIDDFIQDRQSRLQKLVKTTRLQQTLSICYLFLQISQQRIYDNQSYLVNFIGHSLSNLLLVLRLYMIKQRRQEFQFSEFQSALAEMEKTSYGQQLTSQRDILLRIQHNTQILTMIHKKLGRNNDKFQQCITRFLKVAEREKYSSSLSAHYIFQFLAMHIHQLDLVGISPTLQLAPKPYAAPAKKQYTLVIQPLGILQKNGTYRPYVHQFMRWACKNFDVILWTWQQTLQVQSIFSDLSQFITTKLYRHHCKIQDNIFIKDLSRLGRDLTKTVIIDFDKRIFTGYQGNGIECRWKGNKGDKSLLVLSQILEEMITSQTSVQDTLIFYAEEIFNVRGY